MPSHKRKTKTFSMYPNLHPYVSDFLESTNPELEFSFHTDDNDDTCTHDRITTVMGSFACHNPRCTNPGWYSKKVAITIRMYDGDQYNARVYYQRCMNCNFLAKPKLNKECYAERVVYWIKRWCGVEFEDKAPVYKGKKKPHQKMFCEGCKAGRCNG
ncbi:hypothetical protein BDV12DRAFT_195202 [Aspergillus spectabilis]